MKPPTLPRLSLKSTLLKSTPQKWKETACAIYFCRILHKKEPTQRRSWPKMTWEIHKCGHEASQSPLLLAAGLFPDSWICDNHNSTCVRMFFLLSPPDLFFSDCHVMQQRHLSGYFSYKWAARIAGWKSADAGEWYQKHVTDMAK